MRYHPQQVRLATSTALSTNALVVRCLPKSNPRSTISLNNTWKKRQGTKVPVTPHFRWNTSSLVGRVDPVLLRSHQRVLLYSEPLLLHYVATCLSASYITGIGLSHAFARSNRLMYQGYANEISRLKGMENT